MLVIKPTMCAGTEQSIPTTEWFRPEYCESQRSQYQFVHPYWWRVGAHRSCIHNEVRSAHTRVLAHKHRPMDQELSDILNEVADQLIGELGQHHPIPESKMLEFLPAHKKKMYAKVLEELAVTGPMPWHSKVKAFVKVEKLRMGDKDPDPRMIQARTPQFNVRLAKFTRSIEHSLYGLQEDGYRLLAKGRNSRQRALDLNNIWSSLTDPVALSLDLSRWDMHCSPDLLRKAHKVYLGCQGNDPELQNLLEQTLHNKCTTKNGLSYKREGNVMSGDMTTALGNCLMVVMILKAFRKLNQIPSNAMRIYDDGDDHLIIVERKIANRVAELISSHYERAGHKLVVEGMTDQIHQVEFCQQRIIEHSHDYVEGGVLEFTPNPEKTIATALCFSAHLDQDSRAIGINTLRYLGSVWEGRAILHQGQPVLGPLFLRLSLENPHRLHRVGQQQTSLTRRLQLDGRSKVTWTRISDAARESYEKAWGISPSMQEQLENISIDLSQNCVPYDNYATQFMGVGNSS